MTATSSSSENAKAARQGGPATDNDNVRGRTSHVPCPSASKIPRQWINEGARLLADARRRQTASAWKAAALHFAGIVERLESEVAAP